MKSQSEEKPRAQGPEELSLQLLVRDQLRMPVRTHFRSYLRPQALNLLCFVLGVSVVNLSANVFAQSASQTQGQTQGQTQVQTQVLTQLQNRDKIPFQNHGKTPDQTRGKTLSLIPGQNPGQNLGRKLTSRKSRTLKSNSRRKSGAHSSAAAASSPHIDPAADPQLSQSVSADQESALRNIGIARFTAAGNVTLSQADADGLVKLIVKELQNKSFLEPKLVERALTARTPADDIKSGAGGDAVDGYLVGEILPNAIYVRVMSGRSGRSLTALKIPLEDTVTGSALQNLKTREQIAAQVADQFIETFPYRGFVTKAGVRLVRINLGSKHGMQRGLHMKVFEFANGNFHGARKDLGEIEVVKVLGPNDSIASSAHVVGQLQPFNKIGFDDKVVTSVADTQGPKRGYAYVGVEDMNMDSQSAAANYTNRTYKMSQAPFFGIGLAIRRFSLDMRYGQARNTDYDVTYTEAVALYRGYQHNRGAWDLDAWIGGRIGIFNVTTSPNILGTLASSTGVSPAFAGSVTYSPSTSISIFSQLDVYYPVIYSGQNLGFLPYSVSGGVSGGARVMFTQRFGVQAGARIKSFRRAVDGLSSVQERQTSFFGDVVVGF